MNSSLPLDHQFRENRQITILGRIRESVMLFSPKFFRQLFLKLAMLSLKGYSIKMKNKNKIFYLLKNTNSSSKFRNHLRYTQCRPSLVPPKSFSPHLLCPPLVFKIFLEPCFIQYFACKLVFFQNAKRNIAKSTQYFNIWIM